MDTVELTADASVDCADVPVDNDNDDGAGLIVTSGTGSCDWCELTLLLLLEIAVIDIESIGSTGKIGFWIDDMGG